MSRAGSGTDIPERCNKESINGARVGERLRMALLRMWTRRARREFARRRRQFSAEQRDSLIRQPGRYRTGSPTVATAARLIGVPVERTNR